MTMRSISFKYPGTDRMILTDATVTVTLGSRAVLLGANGAGKSTFLKLLVGDLELMEDDGAGGPPKGHLHPDHTHDLTPLSPPPYPCCALPSPAG